MTATLALRTSRRKAGLPAKIVGIVFLALLALLWLLPFLWAIDTSFKSEADATALPLSWWPAHGFNFDAYADILAQGQVTTWMFNSLVVAVAATAITLAISALAAYGLSRTRFRGRAFIVSLIIAAIVVPGQILIVPLFQEMLSFNLVDTYWGLILPQVVHPVFVYILMKFFDAIPEELEDAARVDGAGPIRVFWSVVLPLSRPILAAVAIFAFIGVWNSFLWPFIVTNDPGLMTLPVGLNTVKSAYGVQYAQNMASAMFAALPLLVVFLIFQRQIIRGVTTTGLGGQ